VISKKNTTLSDKQTRFKQFQAEERNRIALWPEPQKFFPLANPLWGFKNE
jgi:hypothetical protein